MNEPKPITLATLSTSTAQEVFDWVVYNLRRQGCKSLKRVNGRVCAYRGVNGTKCAAGWLIADDEYDPRWDKGTSYRWHNVAAIKGAYTHLSLIAVMQRVHDMFDVCSWEAEWRVVASVYELVYSPPQTESV